MSADPPLIISSDQPFQVQATPSKMGGVDALAKRPLDMSGKPEPLTEHLESVAADAPSSDTWVTLPADSQDGLGGEGPVLQEQIDTSHREYFDDPSRYLRTDVVVKLPSAGSSHAEGGGLVAGQGDAVDPPKSAQMPVADASRLTNARSSARAKRAALRAQRTPSTIPPLPSGTPQQRRDAFNQRLAGIISRQHQIHEELSAVEQAVQSTRASLEHNPEDEAHHKS